MTDHDLAHLRELESAATRGGRERGDNGYGACPDRAVLAEPDAPEGSES